MKVSIITPVFNNEKFIDVCINSVLNQDYENIEHIVIDGGSTDSTIEILNKFKNNIKIISEKDNGIYDAINKGIKVSSGEIVGILNADDFFNDNNVVSRIVGSFNNSNI
jgi:glycosyltransferase involved in cell wall biosynthesis